MDTHAYIVGRILLRQEGRFYLVDESGATHHFVADHGFRPDDSVLARWQHEQTLIAVRYRNAPGLLALSALEAGPADEPGPPPTPVQEHPDERDTEQA